MPAGNLVTRAWKHFYSMLANCLLPFIKHFVCPFSGHFRGQYTHFFSLRRVITRHPPYSFTLTAVSGPLVAEICYDLIRLPGQWHHGSLGSLVAVRDLYRTY